MLGMGLFKPAHIESDRPNLHLHLGPQECHAQSRSDGGHLSVRRLGLRMPRLRPGQEEPGASRVAPPPPSPNHHLCPRALRLPLYRRRGSPAPLRPPRLPLQGIHLGGKPLLVVRQLVAVADQGVTLHFSGPLVFLGSSNALLHVPEGFVCRDRPTCHGCDC